MRWSIDPVPKPRPHVLRNGRVITGIGNAAKRYKAFVESCHKANVRITRGGIVSITFHVPMPKSWSKKKRDALRGRPHQQRPDLDNYVKAVMDACLNEDSIVHTIIASKVWSDEGALEVPCHIGPTGEART